MGKLKETVKKMANTVTSTGKAMVKAAATPPKNAKEMASLGAFGLGGKIIGAGAKAFNKSIQPRKPEPIINPNGTPVKKQKPNMVLLRKKEEPRRDSSKEYLPDYFVKGNAKAKGKATLKK